MGCDAEKEKKFPNLLCDFEKGNQEQKEYCIKLRDNFQHKTTIRYQIKYGEQFSVKFQLKGKIHMIQNNFDNSEECMKKTLQDIYNLLDGK